VGHRVPSHFNWTLLFNIRARVIQFVDFPCAIVTC